MKLKYTDLDYNLINCNGKQYSGVKEITLAEILGQTFNWSAIKNIDFTNFDYSPKYGGIPLTIYIQDPNNVPNDDVTIYPYFEFQIEKPNNTVKVNCILRTSDSTSDENIYTEDSFSNIVIGDEAIKCLNQCPQNYILVNDLGVYRDEAETLLANIKIYYTD